MFETEFAELREAPRPEPCTTPFAWLIKLGREVNPKLTDEEAALKYGAEQFKLVRRKHVRGELAAVSRKRRAPGVLPV